MPRKKADFHYPGGFTTKEAYDRAKKTFRKHDKTHYHRYTLRLKYDEEDELIDFLTDHYNINGYIKELVLKDKLAMEKKAIKNNSTVKALLEERNTKDEKEYAKLRKEIGEAKRIK